MKGALEIINERRKKIKADRKKKWKLVTEKQPEMAKDIMLMSKAFGAKIVFLEINEKIVIDNPKNAIFNKGKGDEN